MLTSLGIVRGVLLFKTGVLSFPLWPLADDGEERFLSPIEGCPSSLGCDEVKGLAVKEIASDGGLS